MNRKDTRLNEWFVPKFGPTGFRIFIGLLFLPYTGMCISFAVIGSLLSSQVLWDRVCAIAAIYALGLGVAAHTVDTIGSKKVKPWGSYFTRRQLWFMALTSLACAYFIGIYYMLLYTPLLWIVAILEGFFVFAYNLEMFNGFFHNNLWFSVSWGALPVLAGFIIQTNYIGLIPLFVSAGTGIISYFHITVSRPYKESKRSGHDNHHIRRLEAFLKVLSLGTVLFALGFAIHRLVFG
ncbi:MAG TPA: hypothetical protein VIP70_01125 [Nitrososphaeraceae archaeon]